MTNNTGDSHATGRSRVQPSDDPREIEQKIDQKRADISYTLRQLEAQISPNHYMNQGLGIVREHGNDLIRTVGRTFKENPAPFIVSGAALAWLALSASSRQGSAHNSDGGSDGTHVKSDASRDGKITANHLLGAPHNAHGDDVEHNNQTTNDNDARLLDDLADALENLSSATVELKDDTKTKYEELRIQAYKQSSKLRDAAKAHAARMNEKVGQVEPGAIRPVTDAQRYIKSQPLIAGLISFAIGAVLGSVVPKNPAESRARGSVTDNAKAKISDSTRPGTQ